NSMWYQDIADRVYIGETINSNFNYNRLLRVIADEIYRAILFMNYLIFSTIIYIIPKIGPFCSFIYFCCIYSFYIFVLVIYFISLLLCFIFTSLTFFVNVFFSSGIFALFFTIISKSINNNNNTIIHKH